jgi:hypothetical protein
MIRFITDELQDGWIVAVAILYNVGAIVGALIPNSLENGAEPWPWTMTNIAAAFLAITPIVVAILRKTSRATLAATMPNPKSFLLPDGVELGLAAAILSNQDRETKRFLVVTAKDGSIVLANEPTKPLAIAKTKRTAPRSIKGAVSGCGRFNGNIVTKTAECTLIAIVVAPIIVAIPLGHVLSQTAWNAILAGGFVAGGILSEISAAIRNARTGVAIDITDLSAHERLSIIDEAADIIRGDEP